MVQEHVGRKRRKEVRQAINMSEEMRRLMLVSIGILAVACVVVLTLVALSFAKVVSLSPFASGMIPLAVVLVAVFVVAPRANRYWTLRDAYKKHCRRYNISKDDMRVLRAEEN